MKFQLTVDERHLAVIEAGLNELPRKLSQPVIDLLLSQIMAQRAAAEAAKAKDKAPEVNGKDEPANAEQHT